MARNAYFLLIARILEKAVPVVATGALSCLLTFPSAFAQATGPGGFLELSRLQAIQGVYQGEVRLQSADGKINDLVSPKANIALSISGDEIFLKTDSDLAGARCQSKVGSIRELMTYAQGDAHLLKAEFAFDPSKCAPRLKADSVLVMLGKDQSTGEVVLETLLTRAGTDHEIQNRRAGSTSVHGYFTLTAK